jgi:hypothetical protein
VSRDHVINVANRGQVERAVPVLQKFEKLEELVFRTIRQSLAKRRQPMLQILRNTHLMDF